MPSGAATPLRRQLARLALPALLVTACSSGTSAPAPEVRADRCTDLADAVALAKLSGTPDEETARKVAESLDNRLSRLGDPAIHGPAAQLHNQLHAVERAHQKGDVKAAEAAAARARATVNEVAAACRLPASRFLG